MESQTLYTSEIGNTSQPNFGVGSLQGASQDSFRATKLEHPDRLRVVVQFACERRRYLPFETSPPGPLSSAAGEGELLRRVLPFSFPLSTLWRGGQGVRFRRADTFDVHRQTEPLPILPPTFLLLG